MQLNITTLSENTAQGLGLISEWGLSILIKADNTTILFDTGQSISAVHNAGVLGHDLSCVDNIVLSHGHLDHTGGLREVLIQMRKQVKVMAHPDIWALKYGKAPDSGAYRYIGVPFQKEELVSRGALFSLSREPVWLAEHIVTTGEIPMTSGFEQLDKNMYVKQDGDFIPDPLLDDRAIIIKTGHGLVVIAGCAHRGIINTVNHARELTGEERIFAVIGGIHLFRASTDQCEETIAALKKMKVEKIGVSHCTGMEASVRIALAFKERFFFNNTGNTINFS